MATAPTLYWYQQNSGTLAPTYFGQLNATVAALCSENAVTAPTAPWQNSIGGTLFSQWVTQTDTAVRALCTALAVTAPIPLLRGSNTGQYESEYLESLDGVVRALCAAPPPYVAEAVHFDGEAWLRRASLTATDNAFFSFSLWMKATASVLSTIVVADTENEAIPFLGFDATAGDEYFLAYAGPTNADKLLVRDSNGPFLNYDVWRHYLGSFDGASQVAKIYITDVAYGDLTVDGDPFVFAMNGKDFLLGSSGDEGSALTGDFADVWIAPGVSLLTAGDIPEATRRKFISAAGKPVDLGADGSTPTGAAPRIFFSGDATSFATNKGTGGAFTLTGSLTNASTSPSD